MIKLSERMKHIVGLAESEVSPAPCKCIAEVGCDHAYITMEIVKRGYALNGIAMDVKKGPLGHAEKNIEKELKNSPYEGRITTRLSDGLSGLEQGEADILVIAGMGGGLMIRILSEGRTVAENIPVWILQPQSECYEVRKYLSEAGQEIVKEDMVLEDGKFYPMFRTVQKGQAGKLTVFREKNYPMSGTVKGSGVHIDEELAWEYGPLLLKEKHPCLLKYLNRKKETNREIFSGMEGEKSRKAVERRREIESELYKIERAIKYFD